MMRARAAAAAAAAGALLACGPASPPRLPAAPGAEIRIWVPTLIHWAPGDDRAVRFAVENGTNRTVHLADADPGGARVAIFDSEDARACGIEPSETPAPRSEGTVELQPGDQVPVRVELREACKQLVAGEYRYEVSYRARRSDGRTISLATRHGTLVVEAPDRSLGRPGSRPTRERAARVP